MHTGYRYKPMSGFSGKGRKSYDNPNDKEPPMWKTLLLVLGAILVATALLVGFVLGLGYFFN